jgi:hypothetical protein
MAGETVKHASVRLPIVLVRLAGRGAAWQAWPDLADAAVRERLSVQGRTEADARQALTALTTTALRRAVCRPVLVIGGGPDYATCVHVINPEPDGWVVYAIRDRRYSASWHSDDGRDELLAQVLAHVGGDPAVIPL